MADKEERENNGINPQLSDTFSNSLFYDNLIASTLNVPTTTNTTGVQDTTSSWNMPYGENPDYSLGYNTWNGYSSQNPDLGNSYADAYATSDHFTAQFTPLLDYYRNSPLGSNSPLGLHRFDPQRQDSPPSSKTQDAPDFGPGSPNSSGLSPNYDFLTSASHGRDLYTDAFQQWCPSVTSPDSSASSTSSPTPFSGRAYDPFGTSDVYPIVESMKQSSMTATLPNPHADAPVETVGPSLPPKAPIKPEKSKPSYSDVAKNKLQTSMKTQIAMERESRKDDNDLKKPNPVPSSSSNGSGSLKGKKSKSRRHNSSSHKNKPLSMEPPAISPDSRYGLDTFDDPSSSLSDLKDKALHSSSGSSSRKGSCSSNGSSFSGGVEEIEKGNFETVPLNVYDIQGPGPGAGTKYDMQTGDILPKSSTSTNSASKSSSVTKPTEGSAKKTCHSKSTTKPNPTEKIFFDPKRIFSQEKKRETTPNNKNYIPNNQQKIKSEEDNVLNNGKSKSNLKSGSTRYINNDLRDSSKKQTNTETRNLSGKVFLDGKEETNRSNPAPQQRKKAENTNTNAKKTTSSQTSDDFLKPGKKVKKDKMRDTSYILGEWLLRLWEWLLWGSNTLLQLLWNLTKLTVSVSLLFIMVLWHFFVNYGSKAWNYVATKVPFLRRYASEHAGNTWYEGSNAAPKPRPCGLKENIPLPSTGDEAMKRLLSCRGKDPYSILGLKADATDDEIRKYYRRQAVLVHPDKNQQPGAEEAFKILGHAFEIIGDADKRRHYDNQRTEAQEIETAMNEFADLFTKFRSKMQEEANLMRCEHCGGKHKRVLTERPAYSARYCNRCSARHPAKEGDVWAESSVLGFLWHYYACMEGKVYDITEWASCQNESFKCMKANEHHVIYRISTGAGRNKNASTRTGGADFEDFLSNLFHHPGATPNGESAAGSFSQFTSGTTKTGQTGQNWSNVNSQAQGPGKKANRKRKGKKH